MRPRTSHIILVAAAVLLTLLLAGEAVDPVLYAAENISTAAHADPSTIEKRSPGDAASVIPLMDELLGHTGTLALTIKIKDYESAQRDLARYSELTSQFDRLVVTLDLSETDIAEFQKNNRQNREAIAALLNDSQRLDELQSLEIEVLDGDQRMAVVYEGEALRQKMRETYTAYAKREPETTRIATHYGANATPYQESVEVLAEVAGAAEEWQVEWQDGNGTSAGGSGGVAPRSPLNITVTPREGRYGENLTIGGRYVDGVPGTPLTIYVDSRIAGNTTLDENAAYAYPYRIGRILAGPHLVYATAGAIFSEVATFDVLPAETNISLAIAEVNRTAVACTGNLTTEDGRAVLNAPVLLRLDGETLISTQTDGNGTYARTLILTGGEHTVRAEFNAAGYPLNSSKSGVVTIQVRGEGLSPFPFIAAIAAALGAGWYIRRRGLPPEPPVPEEPDIEPPPEIAETGPSVEIEGLPPRDAATILFRALRERLGIPATKTPRECARLAPDHVVFFERYERIRYAGETPTDEELRAMEREALGRDD